MDGWMRCGVHNGGFKGAANGEVGLGGRRGGECVLLGRGGKGLRRVGTMYGMELVWNNCFVGL